MRFFTSLIVLVPLVFSVVALPASTQDEVTTITSAIKAVVAQLESDASDLQGLTKTDAVAQAEQVAFDLNETVRLVNTLANAVYDYSASYFSPSDAAIIFPDTNTLVGPLTQLASGLTFAALDFLPLLSPIAFNEYLVQPVEAFVGAFNGFDSAIGQKFSPTLAAEWNILSGTLRTQLASITAAF